MDVWPYLFLLFSSEPLGAILKVQADFLLLEERRVGGELLFIECPPMSALCEVLGNMVLWEEKEPRDRRRCSHRALSVTIWLQAGSYPL